MSEATTPGGLSDLKNGSKLTQEMLDQVKQKVEAAVNHTLPIYQAVTFKSQVVAGEIFYVKVFIGGENNCIHVKIPKLHPETSESSISVQENKNFLSPIEYF